MAAKTSGLCERLRSTFSGLCCESAVVTLTLVSVLAISGEILIEYGILSEPADDTSSNNAGANSTTKPNTSRSSDQTSLETVQKVFHYISLAIAGLFFLEILAKILAFRVKFFVQPWQVLDMLVVIATLAVEVAFEVMDRDPELEVCTFIVIFRLWRLPHVCSIKARAVQRDMEQEIEVWKAGASKMEDRCNTLHTWNIEQKEKIDRLEQELSALKKEIKDSNRNFKKNSGAVATPNGTVPRDSAESSVPNHLTANSIDNKRQPARPMVTAYSEDDEDTIDGSPSNMRREEEAETETDTVEEDDGEVTNKRKYFPSGSESSLSCQAMEQEVQVQIEDKTKSDVMSSAEGSNSAVNTPVERRKKIVWSQDKKGYKAEVPADREVYYENGGYVPDVEEEEGAHGVLVHEIDGTRTYRSAEGIPMTDL